MSDEQMKRILGVFMLVLKPVRIVVSSFALTQLFNWFAPMFDIEAVMTFAQAVIINMGIGFALRNIPSKYAVSVMVNNGDADGCISIAHEIAGVINPIMWLVFGFVVKALIGAI